MTSLMEKINQQKTALEAREAKRANRGPRLPFWRPKSKKNTIRILPPWTKEGPFADQFWKEVGQHWNVKEDQEGPVLCPKTSEGFPDDSSCPICDFANKLKLDKNNIAAQKLYKEIHAKKTYLLPIMDLSDPTFKESEVAAMGEDTTIKVGDPKIQVYACPISAWNDILGIMANNKIDITDLKEGRDLVIEKKQMGGGKEYVKYTVQPLLAASPAKVPAGFVTPSLENVGWKMDMDELLALLAEGCGGSYVAALPAVSKVSSKEEDDGGYLAGDSSSKEDDDDLEARMRASLED